MLKRFLGLAILVLAGWGSGCTSAPPSEEPAQWSAIRFELQASEPQADSAAGQKISR